MHTHTHTLSLSLSLSLSEQVCLITYDWCGKLENAELAVWEVETVCLLFCAVVQKVSEEVPFDRYVSQQPQSPQSWHNCVWLSELWEGMHLSVRSVQTLTCWLTDKLTKIQELSLEHTDPFSKNIYIYISLIEMTHNFSLVFFICSSSILAHTYFI